jgi:MoxR-like ATPase
MSDSALKDILLDTEAELHGEQSTDDERFDPLGHLSSAERAANGRPAPTKARKPAAKVKAGSKAKAAKAKPAKNSSKQAASAVREAMAAIEPDAPKAQAKPEQAPDAPSGKRLEPITRPNGASYRPRVLGSLTDVETLRICRDHDLPVLLGGYPGCGKTALVEAAFGAEVITVNGHGDLEVSDLIGGYTQRPDGNYEWVDGPLTIAMREGKVLFVDDCTLIGATVLARLYPAMDDRKRIKLTEHTGEEINAAEGFFVVGAHNPGAPGAVLAEPLASRFTVHIEVESDLRMALKMGVDSRIVHATASLQDDRATGQVAWAPEMRELLDFKRVESALGAAAAAANLIAAAPDDLGTREHLISTLRTWFPEVEALRLSGQG